MEAFEFCIDSLRGIVPGVLNSGKNNLTAAKSSIELANSCTVEGVDTSGLTNAIAWIDRTIGFVNQWGGWIQEKISALEKLDSDNNQLASLLGEDVDINNIDLDKIIEQAEKLLPEMADGALKYRLYSYCHYYTGAEECREEAGRIWEALNPKGKLSAIKKAEADACFREFVSQKE